MKPQALIIEDEKLVSWSLGKFLEKSGFQVSISEYGKEGIKMAGKNPPDLLFVDYRLPDITGLDVLQELQEIKDETIFFFMTAYGTEEVSIQALKLGAYKYLNKPINFDELTILIGRALDKKETIHSLDLLKKHEQELFKIGEFVSKSDSMRKIIESVHKIVESKTGTILLLGETGTGKDTLARIIHEQSPRKSKPFIIVNCAALSENLLASELFGHEKGAFTDAKSKKLGQVELASGGTV
ncbi:MAG: sigma-54-dependent transcriptional regulator, partial [Fidelibacterota bacterium]